MWFNQGHAVSQELTYLTELQKLRLASSEEANETVTSG